METQVSDKIIDSFINRCRETGLSVTPQRMAIYKTLVQMENHPSPDMIYKEIKSEFPTISFATVYKTLETFEHKGIISKVTTLHNTLRYDPLTCQHHHIICTKCKKIVDIESTELNSLLIPKQIIKDNQLIDYSVHFNVICSDCQKGRG